MVTADEPERPRRSAVGGAADEAGGGFRAGVAAYVAAHMLRGQPFADLDLLPEQAVPQSFRLEADAAVDDLVVQLTGGSAFVQAKRHLDFVPGADSSLKDTVDQWISLQLERGLDPLRERVVAVAATASGPVHALSRALRRRRRSLGGSYSSDEREALRRLEALLSEVSQEARERLLRSAVIWVADLEETDGVSARLGQALLEPGVVAVDQGVTAWKTLRALARDLARRRYGAQLDDLLEALRQVPLTLTADSEGYAAARRQERQLKLGAYRRRVQQRGEALNLRALGAALPSVPLAEMDARIAVYAPPAPSEVEDADERSNNGGLAWALRRRGRALLLGLPGSGKSVALRACAAHYAARPSWPLPIVVPLDRVARLVDVRGFGDALLEVAFQQEPVEDQTALRAAAVDALRSGEGALFLDALDETRSVRHDVVAGIEQELAATDPAVEVLVSTRDVAYADAHTLGLADLRLVAPDRPNDAARAVLRASAEQRQLPASEAQDWVRGRAEWVDERLRADRALGETPLMVVLLALVAAKSSPDVLPHGRAAVLKRVVSDVIVRWEAGRRLHGEVAEIGNLRGTDAIRAADLAFSEQQEWLGQLLAREDGREPVLLAAGLHGALADALATRVVDAPADTDRLYLVAASVRQGARLDQEVQAQLVDAVLGTQTTSQEQRRDDALALVQLPLQPGQHRMVLDFFDPLNEPARVVARALSVDGWSREDDEVDADLLAVLRLDPNRVRRPGAGFFAALGPDPDYQAAVLSAGRRLLRPGQRHVAELVNERIHRGLTAAASVQLRRRLIETGFRQLVDQAERQLAQNRQHPDYEAMFEESDRARDGLLEMIAGAAAAGPLTAIQRRRLDDLVSLVRTSGFDAAPAGDATHGILRDGDRLQVVLRAAALLAGLDLSVLAAEAEELRAVIAEETEDQFGPFFMLSDGGRQLDLTAWDRIAHPAQTAFELAGAVSSPYAWIGQLAARCLAATPDGARDVALARLDDQLPDRHAYVEYMVALTALILARHRDRLDKFAGDPRPMVRRAAARYWGGYGTRQEQLLALRALLADGDAGVRKEAVQALRHLGVADSLRGDLADAAEQTGWECFWCGSDNAAGVTSCRSCQLSGPDVARAVQQALAA